MVRNEDTEEVSAASEEAAATAEPEAPAAAADPIADARAARIDVIVEDWFRSEIHNSPASQQTPIYNHVRSAVDSLKRTLSREL